MGTAAILNWNRNSQEVGSQTPKTMAASSSSGSESASGAGAAAVTANDFLTLLVAEMKNQDPTANRDPNEYVNQLVQVNSLQQLISINEVLTNALGDPDSSSTPAASTQAAVGHISGSAIRLSSAITGKEAPVPPLTRHTSGNLGIPKISAAALGIAHALDSSRRK